jgi:hypothetical protein
MSMFPVGLFVAGVIGWGNPCISQEDGHLTWRGFP